jgi:hypothetical protein
MVPLCRLSRTLHSLALGVALMPALLTATRAEAAPKPWRFAIIPKVNHPWFDAVRRGAEQAAGMIQQQKGTAATVARHPQLRGWVVSDASGGSVVQSTAAGKPRAQGYWSVLSLWQERLAAPAIERIDTGITVLAAPAAACSR